MNKDIYLQASKGGKARSASLSQARRIEIARNASLQRHKQAISKDEDSPSLQDKYAILCEFIRSKGASPTDIIEDALASY